MNTNDTNELMQLLAHTTTTSELKVFDEKLSQDIRKISFFRLYQRADLSSGYFTRRSDRTGRNPAQLRLPDLKRNKKSVQRKNNLPVSCASP